MRQILIIGFLITSLLSFGQTPALPEGFEVIHMCQNTEVKSQDRTGTCWSFSTSSFLESEVLKQSGQVIDLSEMYTVRMIYVEKAVKYIRYHGGSNFSQGSLAHDVVTSYIKYGMMPESAYSGKIGSEKHNHSTLVSVLKTYLDSLSQYQLVQCLYYLKKEEQLFLISH